MSEWNLYYGSEEHTPWPITEDTFSRLEWGSREEVLRKLKKAYDTLLDIHIYLSDEEWEQERRWNDGFGSICTDRILREHC